MGLWFFFFFVKSIWKNKSLLKLMLEEEKNSAKYTKLEPSERK